MMSGTMSGTAYLNSVMQKKMAIKEEERNRIVPEVKQIVEDVLDAMKQVDDLFKFLYKNLYYTGSFYDGLRVSDAKEFDLNVVLKQFVSNKYLVMESRRVDPGFIKIHVTDDPAKMFLRDHPSVPHVPKFVKYFVEADAADGGKRYLVPFKMRPWLESVMVRALSQLGDRRVSMRKGGPAFNLQITTLHGEKVDVDLVPVFDFKTELLSSHKRTYDVIHRNVQENFFVVPKKSKKACRNADYFWRLDFHDQEKSLLHDKGIVKPIIKFLKLFRDHNKPQTDNISSYALKNLVMLMIREDPRERWPAADIERLLKKALLKLLGHLESGIIPWYFDFQCDVLWGMNPLERKDKACWLKKALAQLEDGKKHWENFL